MRTLRLLAIMLLFMFCSFGCTTAYKSIGVASVADIKLEPLKPADYIILEEVEGVGSKGSFLGGFGFALDGVTEKAQRDAAYQAVSRVEGADMLLAPRYEIETFLFPIFFGKAKVKVKAKAIRILTSDER